MFFTRWKFDVSLVVFFLLNFMNFSLEELREKIDALDDQIVDLLGERFRLILEVSNLKKEQNLEVYQSSREQEILVRVLERGKQYDLNPLLLQALFLQIFAVSKRNQGKQV